MICTQIPLTEAKHNLANLCQQVVDDREVVILTRNQGENVALIAADELSSLMETAYLLKSPANAIRLLTALQEAETRNPVIEAEARANNQAYQTLKAELEQKYLGKWIVIAHGQLQGVGDSIMELNHLSSDAHHRIVMQVGQQYSKKVELGWQIAFN